MKVPMYNQTGNKLNDIEVSEAVFGIDGYDELIHSAVIRHLANGRQGTAHSKTRAEARGGGRKPWRQKGTGRARHGSIRSPIWRGGGVAFGPRTRDFSLGMPKRTRRLALLAALSAKARAGSIVVLDELGLAEPKTKTLLAVLDAVQASAGGRSALIVTSSREPNVVLSARNLPAVRAIESRNINVYDVVKYDRIIMTRAALTAMEEALAS